MIDDEGRVQPDYGPRRDRLVVSIYRDRACTDLSTVVELVAGADTLTVDAPCTLRFNEAAAGRW